MTGLGRACHRAGQGQRVEAVEELVQDDPALESGQCRPEAEVRSEAETHVRVGMAVDAQLAGVGPEHLLVPVGRGVDQQDRVAGGHLDATDGGGGRRGAHERDHGGRPAQQLLDGGRDEGPIRLQRGPLRRILGQRHQPARDQVAGGLVPRHQQLNQEHRQLRLGQLLAAALRIGSDCRQDRDEVVRRRLPPFLGDADQVLPHLDLVRRPLLLGLFDFAGDDGLGPVEEPRPLGSVHPEQLADHQEGERDGEVLHDVERHAALDLVQEPCRFGGHAGLHQAHHRRLEARLHQPPVAGVLRRVGVHHGRGRLVGRADLVDQDPPRRAEARRVGADVRHLGVGRHGPEAAALVVDPAHRRRSPELGVQREGVVVGVERRVEKAAGVGGIRARCPLVGGHRVRRSIRWGAGRPGPRAGRSTPRACRARRRPIRRSRPRPGSTTRPR